MSIEPEADLYSRLARGCDASKFQEPLTVAKDLQATAEQADAPAENAPTAGRCCSSVFERCCRELSRKRQESLSRAQPLFMEAP